MSIERRIEKLEEQAGADEQVVVLVHYIGDDTEPTEEQKEAAIADFKAKHPDRGDLIVLYWEDGQYDTDEFKPVLNHFQTAAKALSGIRAADESEVSFVRAISIIKEKLDELGEKEIVFTSEEALSVLRDGGLDWIIEPKDARKVLRKLGLESRSHRREDKVIRGYLIEKERLEDFVQRYGG